MTYRNHFFCISIGLLFSLLTAGENENVVAESINNQGNRFLTRFIEPRLKKINRGNGYKKMVAWARKKKEAPLSDSEKKEAFNARDHYLNPIKKNTKNYLCSKCDPPTEHVSKEVAFDHFLKRHLEVVGYCLPVRPSHKSLSKSFSSARQIHAKHFLEQKKYVPLSSEYSAAQNLIALSTAASTSSSSDLRFSSACNPTSSLTHTNFLVPIGRITKKSCSAGKSKLNPHKVITTQQRIVKYVCNESGKMLTEQKKVELLESLQNNITKVGTIRR